jgi:hypothetical protein
MLAARDERAVGLETHRSFAVTRLFRLDICASAVELAGYLAALLLERREPGRKRRETVFELIELEVIGLHSKQGLNVRMHGGEWT